LDKRTLNRAIVQQRVGDLKGEASQKPVPMEGALAEALSQWSAQSAYPQLEDWVFASPELHGAQPYWLENLLRRHIRLASSEAGRHHEDRGLAFLPQDVCDTAEGKW
jgi:hypothetical protein